MPLVPINVLSKAGRRGLLGQFTFTHSLGYSYLSWYASQRENLLRQIREKNETISVLLHRLRNTSIATPISINASRLLLNPAEREAHGEVLSWMERRHALTAQASEKACVQYDTSLLEDDDMYSSSEDDDDEDGSEKAVVRSTPASHGPPDPAQPEDLAPFAFLASVSSHWNKSGASSPTPDLFGIANKRYFQPSKSQEDFFLKTGVSTRDSFQARIPI